MGERGNTASSSTAAAGKSRTCRALAACCINEPMKHPSPLFLLFASSLATSSALAADLVQARDGSGVVGYKDTPKLPWCEWLVHDPDRPAPKRVDPGPAPAPAPVPADAVVLFDGKDLAQWQPADWKLVDGCLEAGDAKLASKQTFGDCQIHVEWMTPANFETTWANRGNNGVFLMGLYEIQIFDSYHEKLYPDGQAAAVYGQTPPLVNVCRKPGEWQTYDLVFTAPRFDGEKLVQPARVTVFHNGVLVQLNQQIYGETGHRIAAAYKQKVSTGPLARERPSLSRALPQHLGAPALRAYPISVVAAFQPPATLQRPNSRTNDEPRVLLRDQTRERDIWFGMTAGSSAGVSPAGCRAAVSAASRHAGGTPAEAAEGNRRQCRGGGGRHNRGCWWVGEPDTGWKPVLLRWRVIGAAKSLSGAC